ncbi:MAG: glycosyltransferase [Alkalinema sp. RU_4_3]|nr:glycosyltransferase [Alkalinema sp. RU_4_3]
MVPIAVLSLVVWVYLVGFRGGFWRTDQQLGSDVLLPELLPTVAIVIPARDEADMLPLTLPPLLGQTYAGKVGIYLIDDGSLDGTGEVARAIAISSKTPLQILQGKPLPPGWTGKLWALDQGINAATIDLNPDYFLLTDADICHSPESLAMLVSKAETGCDLVSLMVRLRCDSAWEKLLIPAFVFFFAKLYPFKWVNTVKNNTAAAAGGCSLIRRSALEEMGGIQALQNALIDDCTLAAKIKRRHKPRNANIWLGLSDRTHSLRPYDDLQTIWDMVARTAYSQLYYSPFLLIGTIFGMGLVYFAGPIALVGGLITQNWQLAAIGGLTYGLMSWAYGAIVRFYQLPWIYAMALPPIALLYSLMTWDSAIRHWRGRGGGWKGRTYKA